MPDMRFYCHKCQRDRSYRKIHLVRNDEGDIVPECEGGCKYSWFERWRMSRKMHKALKSPTAVMEIGHG